MPRRPPRAADGLPCTWVLPKHPCGFTYPLPAAEARGRPALLRVTASAEARQPVLGALRPSPSCKHSCNSFTPFGSAAAATGAVRRQRLSSPPPTSTSRRARRDSVDLTCYKPCNNDILKALLPCGGGMSSETGAACSPAETVASALRISRGKSGRRAAAPAPKPPWGIHNLPGSPNFKFSAVTSIAEVTAWLLFVGGSLAQRALLRRLAARSLRPRAGARHAPPSQNAARMRRASRSVRCCASRHLRRPAMCGSSS